MHWSTWKSFVKDLQSRTVINLLYINIAHLRFFQIKREINLASESHHTRPCRGRHVCSMTFVFFLIDYCNPQSFGLQSKLLDLFSFLAMRVTSFPLFGVKKHRCLTFPNICRDLSGRFEWHILLFLPIIWTNVSSIIVNPAPFLLKRKVQSIKMVRKKGWHMDNWYSICDHPYGLIDSIPRQILCGREIDTNVDSIMELRGEIIQPNNS